MKDAEKRKNKRLKLSAKKELEDVAVEEAKVPLPEPAEVIDTTLPAQSDSDDDFEEEEYVHDGSDPVGFTVIGEVRPRKLKPVKVPLPRWIREPVYFDKSVKTEEETSDVLSPCLNEKLNALLAKNGVTHLFPVQTTMISYLTKLFAASRSFRPPDVCVSSPTGSGKTLAFALPVIQYLSARVETKIRALVVVPVRDLAIQVFQVFETYCKGSSLKAGCAVGHESFQDDVSKLIQRKKDGSFRSSVDILVCTPGRLVDLIHRATGFDLTSLKFLVLDEADKMMTGELEHNWLKEVEKAVYGDATMNSNVPCLCSLKISDQQRVAVEGMCGCAFSSYSSTTSTVQKLLFSATLSTDAVKLQSMNLFQPKLFMASEISTASTNASLTKTLTPNELKEKMIITAEDKKPLVLWYLIETLGYRRVLCFTGSIENTHRLYVLLKNIPKIHITEFGSHLPSKTRDQQLKKFVAGEIDVIVCSDIMARGMDISDVSYVVCYDPPSNETAYVHRIGRTARAGKAGVAITLIAPNQQTKFQGLLRRAHKKSSIEKLSVQTRALKKLAPKYKEALKQLQKSVSNEKRNFSFRNKLVVTDLKK